METN
ncbi:hypothetical protein CFP56_003939 [Quercus suber]|jgi:hypothetical protein